MSFSFSFELPSIFLGGGGGERRKMKLILSCRSDSNVGDGGYCLDVSC